MNYCPVCKREFKEQTAAQTRLCPVCGSRLRKISEDELQKLRLKSRRS